MNLVLIETSGNQRYIFATNKLRENVGASELTYRVGTKTALEAVEEVTKEQKEKDPTKQVLKLWSDELSGKEVRANLLNQGLNPKLEDGKCDVEVIVATSGKAILLVRTDEVGKGIIRRVTQTALREMPGLTVHGAISNEVEADLANIHEAMDKVHRKLEDVRYRMPSNEQRFLRLPFFAQCFTSGLPAQKEANYEQQKKVYSQVSCTKSDNKKDGQERIKEILNFRNLIEPEDIEKCAWTAVIHADGNGLGQIFLDFNQYAGFDQYGNWNGRQYLDEYRKFSLALDVCTIKATKTSLEHLWGFVAKREAEKQQKEANALSKEELNKLKLPVVPLVLGGDDLTVLCDGEYALKFTRDFLTAFEDETKKSDIIKTVATKAFGKDYLGICAGVAIVKPHFPFHQAYELAESLLKSAKQVKEKIKHLHKGDEVALPSSAVDFHILYDSAYSELDAIRERLRVDEERTWLYAKPYVVTDESQLLNAKDKPWFEKRRFCKLKKRVEAMRKPSKDDLNKRALPNNQLHGLREALFLGKSETDARTKLIDHRYREAGFDKLLCGRNKERPSLFFKEKHKDEDKEEGYTTHFMDALDVVEFWKGFEEPQQSEKENDK